MTHTDPAYVITLERLILDAFSKKMSIRKVVLNRIPVSRTDYATVFITDQKQVYVYIDTKSQQTLGSIHKIVSRMGFVADEYIPPFGRKNYFSEIAYTKFKAVFPGRTHASPEDLRYYKTLVAYSPALVRIASVPQSMVYCFDSDAAGGWRPVKKLSYTRITMND